MIDRWMIIIFSSFSLFSVVSIILSRGRETKCWRLGHGKRIGRLFLSVFLFSFCIFIFVLSFFFFFIGREKQKTTP
ncbi:hypothetical protein F4810DRAFT_641952 [Camillea tinctor]|nr:hypothetical protein F4810DRAFT_641952 [Camillea tinctor]